MSSIGTPIVNDNSKNIEQPCKDPISEEETENYSESNSGTNGSGLDQAIEDIIQSERMWYMEIDETQILIDYIDSKLPQGLKREDLTKRIISPSQKNIHNQICKEQQKIRQEIHIMRISCKNLAQKPKFSKKRLETREWVIRPKLEFSDSDQVDVCW